jgi:glucosylceramidase
MTIKVIQTNQQLATIRPDGVFNIQIKFVQELLVYYPALNYRLMNKLNTFLNTFLFGAILAGLPATAFAQDGQAATGSGVPPHSFRTILTTKDTDARLTEQPGTPVSRVANGSVATVFLDPAKPFQTIEGFGGAFTEAAAVTWQKMSPTNQQAIINAYFDAATGHGYTLCRTHINSCDFSTGNYAYDEVPGDTELTHFSIARDQQALLPMIKAALAASRTPFKLFATPWSPPAWMKTNGQMNHGGKLKPEDRTAWANYFVRYIQEYQKHGVHLWGLTMQNEPEANSGWDNCLYSPVEERDFIRDYLGPTLDQAGLNNVKIMAWDHNRDDMVEYADAMYSDPAASRYVWGTAFHWYSDGAYQNMQEHHDAWPDKPLLLTEACQDWGPHTGDWGLGERYATDIINDLNRWSVGWVDWNLVLDEKGGPNHANNFCSAPIIADTQHDTLLFQSSYYYMGHFARFIRPGARRILCSSSQNDLQATACVNANGVAAIVVMNRTGKALKFNLKSPNSASVVSLPARSIATYLVNVGDL